VGPARLVFLHSGDAASPLWPDVWSSPISEIPLVWRGVHTVWTGLPPRISEAQQQRLDAGLEEPLTGLQLWVSRKPRHFPQGERPRRASGRVLAAGRIRRHPRAVFEPLPSHASYTWALAPPSSRSRPFQLVLLTYCFPIRQRIHSCWFGIGDGVGDNGVWQRTKAGMILKTLESMGAPRRLARCRPRRA
jgi:hypothetical protein